MSVTLPGCCPPLQQCYDDVQAATEFIKTIMLDLIQTDPDIAQGLIDAIIATGAALPLIGVTDGSDAQPGQVGEWLEFIVDPVSFPGGVSQQTITLGIAQPGDWNLSYIIQHEQADPADTHALVFPIPVGFSGGMPTVQGRYGNTLVSPLARASLSVPTLVPLQINFDATTSGPGSCRVVMHGRRVR